MSGTAGMRDAVICEPLRTPVGGFGGALRDVAAHELAATVIRALLQRTREMQRRDARYGLQTMCIGGGQGLAPVLERVPGS